MSSCPATTGLSRAAPYRSSSSSRDLGRPGYRVPPPAVTPMLPPVPSTRCTSRSAAPGRYVDRTMPGRRRRTRPPQRAAASRLRRPGSGRTRGEDCPRSGRGDDQRSGRGVGVLLPKSRRRPASRVRGAEPRGRRSSSRTLAGCNAAARHSCTRGRSPSSTRSACGPNSRTG